MEHFYLFLFIGVLLSWAIAYFETIKLKIKKYKFLIVLLLVIIFFKTGITALVYFILIGITIAVYNGLISRKDVEIEKYKVGIALSGFFATMFLSEFRVIKIPMLAIVVLIASISWLKKDSHSLKTIDVFSILVVGNMTIHGIVLLLASLFS